MMGREKGKRIGPIHNREKKEGEGAWCYNARIKHSLTIDDLSKLARVSVRTIKRIENGEAVFRSTRRAILHALDVTFCGSAQKVTDRPVTFSDRKKCQVPARGTK